MISGLARTHDEGNKMQVNPRFISWIKKKRQKSHFVKRGAQRATRSTALVCSTDKRARTNLHMRTFLFIYLFVCLSALVLAIACECSCTAGGAVVEISRRSHYYRKTITLFSVDTTDCCRKHRNDRASALGVDDDDDEEK